MPFPLPGAFHHRKDADAEKTLDLGIGFAQAFNGIRWEKIVQQRKKLVYLLVCRKVRS
jgi:hypothetical protein